MACFFLQRRTCFTKNRMGELLLSTSDYYIKELGKEKELIAQEQIWFMQFSECSNFRWFQCPMEEVKGQRDNCREKKRVRSVQLPPEDDHFLEIQHGERLINAGKGETFTISLETFSWGQRGKSWHAKLRLNLSKAWTQKRQRNKRAYITVCNTRPLSDSGRHMQRNSQEDSKDWEKQANRETDWHPSLTGNTGVATPMITL